MTVPTKLSAISRFAIHGHDFSSAIAQLFLTLGVQPYLILPCSSGYTVGFFTRFHILSTIHQAWIEVALLAVCSTFALLLTINRALAVSLGLCWTMKDSGEEGRKICIKKIKVYPKEMDTMNGVNMVLVPELAIITSIVYMIVMTFFYIIVTRKSSQSAQFLANQRRLTGGVISFMMMGLIGIGIPTICLIICSFFGLGNLIIFQCSIICMCLYPIFGSYHGLMSNADYRNRIHSIMKRARKITSLSQEWKVTVIS
ncbi:unnamed protein product [Auanema sp. JU1783]|nr:unnamed protein product [Auanema sp. JU1783]